MGRLRITAHAEADIDEIANYIAKDNFPAAMRWLTELDAKMRSLSDWPGMGVLRPELQPDIRSFPFGNYLIFYVLIDGGIEVRRLIHAARNLPDQFRSDY